MSLSVNCAVCPHSRGELLVNQSSKPSLNAHHRVHFVYIYFDTVRLFKEICSQIAIKNIEKFFSFACLSNFFVKKVHPPLFYPHLHVSYICYWMSVSSAIIHHLVSELQKVCFCSFQPTFQLNLLLYLRYGIHSVIGQWDAQKLFCIRLPQQSTDHINCCWKNYIFSLCVGLFALCNSVRNLLWCKKSFCREAAIFNKICFLKINFITFTNKTLIRFVWWVCMIAL